MKLCRELAFSGNLSSVFSSYREKVEVKETVYHRSVHQHHHRTQSVQTRRPLHPARLTGALKQKLPTLTWLCQCMKRTKQSTVCDISVRHASCTVSGCAFVASYQSTSNLENHYFTTGTDHKELADRLTVRWLVRKNRALSMSKNDDELNKFIDEVTDGAYNLSCVEVIFKLVKQIQVW